MWCYFVAARLMPVNVNSEVLKRCALLTYAIMTNKDVGYVINQEFYAMIAKTKWKDSVGFSAVITTLCLKARTQFKTSSSKDEVPWKPNVARSLIVSSTTPKKIKRARQEESSN